MLVCTGETFACRLLGVVGQLVRVIVGLKSKTEIPV